MAALRKSFYDFYSRMKAIQGAGGEAPLIENKKLSLTDLVNTRPSWGEIDWKKVPSEKVSERDRPMRDLVRGKLRAFINCPTASDVFKAFELIDANHLDATLVLGPDAWKLADILAARKGLGPVIINPQLEVWDKNDETGAEKRRLTPILLPIQHLIKFLLPDHDLCRPILISLSFCVLRDDCLGHLRLLKIPP